MTDTLKIARDALARIARWHDEFPDTGRQWDNGDPVSYGAAFGSNGERDFMRQVAIDAITAIDAQAPQAAPVALTPLTQDTVLDMAEGISLQFHDLLAFARAIERAHGIGAAAQGGEHGILR